MPITAIVMIRLVCLCNYRQQQQQQKDGDAAAAAIIELRAATAAVYQSVLCTLQDAAKTQPTTKTASD